MKITNNIFSCINIKITFLVILAISATNICHAASQGKLGRSSSASIGISVHVNQSLSTVSPPELLLSQNKSEPLCIMHNGYTQNANVPYALKIDEIKVLDQNNDGGMDNQEDFLFNVFLEDRYTAENKQKLSPGMSFSKQTRLSSRKQHKQDCRKAGMQLSIEKTNNEINLSDTQLGSTGLLILLVSPD